MVSSCRFCLITLPPVAAVGFFALLGLLSDVVACFPVNAAPPTSSAVGGATFTSLFLGSTGSSARDLLYQDQQDAMLRRALHEQRILTQDKKIKELLAPKLVPAKAKSGTGFGGSASNRSNMDPSVRMASEQAAAVRREGVIRVDNVIMGATADNLREYVLEQQRIAAIETDRDASTSRTYYGVENRRRGRCDLQLSLLRGGFAAYLGDDDASDAANLSTFALGDALQEMLGKDGTLRRLFEDLVTPVGELYELAAVITDRGSDRQMVHPDLPYQENAPLYVIFLALQDVTEGMGPTSFLLRTHTGEANAIFASGDVERKDEQLSNADCRISTLSKGDAVLFDARILHYGNANDERTRVLFNFSFRNPQVRGSLGYKGSIRPGYEGAMSLGGMADALAAYESGDENPFAKYN
jgi:hypothetical protein